MGGLLYLRQASMDMDCIHLEATEVQVSSELQISLRNFKKIFDLKILVWNALYYLNHPLHGYPRSI